MPCSFGKAVVRGYCKEHAQLFNISEPADSSDMSEPQNQPAPQQTARYAYTGPCKFPNSLAAGCLNLLCEQDEQPGAVWPYYVRGVPTTSETGFA